ncbi:family 43 glycosylhydrolase [Sedimentisphaera salicampi]|uniref:Beta-xylosidase n=1 Tax=Sedimentisphaera salicampi TaxID=1941349 RepID=A0A1W6LNT9_9BACT|nr:family 43 glycosylhydrolase [Sedimentisphaera salicampi]ARN57465.1 Beta-xylosidase [Sedimentisphaera salicampi]OXU14481.1 Beta-xylosidase [Sedimentisphaera salicampi]
MRKITLFLLVLICVSLFAALPAEEIKEGLKARNKALHIKDGWIRDPYIILMPDGWYYLTGTTKLPENPKHLSNKYNKNVSPNRVGHIMRLWRSRNLIDWEYIGAPYSLADGIWPKVYPEKHREINDWRLWAPEMHFIDGRWAIVHTSPAPVNGANLSLTKGRKLEGPYLNPMGKNIRKRHDPTLFQDESGRVWLIWGAANIVPLKEDFSGVAGKWARIWPSNRKIGHEGCMIRKIGDKFVLFGTGWSTDKMRKGSYNLYYCVSDKINSGYGKRKFAGRFLGHGTLFKDKSGKWWCTAFYNANVPVISREEAKTKDLSDTAYTVNKQGVTIVPMDIRQLESGEIHVEPLDPLYAEPGKEEAQEF